MEQIALDMGALLVAQLPHLAHRASELQNAGLVARMRAGGRVLCEELGLEATIRHAETWSSDTMRGWSAMAVGFAHDLPLAERLRLIRQFADDSHFAVREWAWLAIRPHIAANLPQAINLLATWTTDPSERLRRFASEATRPRGVWSVHLVALKHDPSFQHSGIRSLEFT